MIRRGLARKGRWVLLELTDALYPLSCIPILLLRDSASQEFSCPMHFTVFLVFPRKLHLAAVLKLSVIPRDTYIVFYPFFYRGMDDKPLVCVAAAVIWVLTAAKQIMKKAQDHYIKAKDYFLKYHATRMISRRGL